MPIAPTTETVQQIARLGRLSLIARTVVEGFLGGLHCSPFKGQSVEFAEHRQYSPGDEIRHIDWRTFAKTDRYFVKEYEEETNLRAHLVVDASGSMAYRGQHESKFHYSQVAAAALAYLMLRQRDAVGLVTHDTRVRVHLPPRAHPSHLARLLDALEETRPGGETGLATVWHEVAERVGRRGLVVLFSDCFDRLDPLLRALRHLRHRGHEVILFQVLAPEEMEFPFSGRTQFRSLENSGDRLLTDARRLRAEYLGRFQAFCRSLREQAGRMRVDCHLLRTDEPVDRALGVYLARRQRGGSANRR